MPTNIYNNYNIFTKINYFKFSGNEQNLYNLIIITMNISTIVTDLHSANIRTDNFLSMDLNFDIKIKHLPTLHFL